MATRYTLVRSILRRDSGVGLMPAYNAGKARQDVKYSETCQDTNPQKFDLSSIIKEDVPKTRFEGNRKINARLVISYSYLVK